MYAFAGEARISNCSRCRHRPHLQICPVIPPVIPKKWW